jgi:hypothetical protein
MGRMMRCGNINSLKANEVVALAPGGRVGLDWLGEPSLGVAGAYKVSVELERIPDLQWQGVLLAEHDAEAMRKLRRSAGFKVVSNVVEIQVRK